MAKNARLFYAGVHLDFFQFYLIPIR